jgi:uncharacterized protein
VADDSRRAARGYVTAAITVAAGAAVWFATAELPTAARLLAVVLVAVLPVVSLEQGRAMREVDIERVPRSALYLSSSLTLWLLAGLTALAAWLSGFSLETLGLLLLPPLPLLAWTLGLTAGGIAVIAASRGLRLRETPLVHHILPETRGEKLAFVGVSVTAGVCEEVVFRGFLIPVLAVATGSVAVAALASSAVFGLLHGYQGAVGVVRTALLGLLLALPLLATGSIVPAILAHFLIDLLVGVWLAPWLRGEPPTDATRAGPDPA